MHEHPVYFFDHILKLTEGTSLATTSEMAENLLTNLSRAKANVKTIIVFDHPSKISKENQQRMKKIEQLGLRVVNFHK